MTGLERILATFGGRPVDRRPVAPLLSLYGARLTGTPLPRHYTDPEAFADGQSAVWETFHPDVLFAPFAVALQAAAFGSRLRWLEHTPPNIDRPVLNAAAEAADLKAPELALSPELRFLIASCRTIAARHGRETPVAGVCLCPTDLPVLLLGLEGWLETLLFDRDNARRLTDLTLPHCVELANLLLGVGAAFVVLSTITVNPGVISSEIFEEFTLPRLRETTRRIAGPVVLHSAGAPVAGFLDRLSGLPNLVGVVVNPGEDLRRAREKAAPELTLIGNLNGPGLAGQTPEAVRAEAAQLLAQQAEEPRFILATSAADVPLDTAPEIIHALCGAAETAGRPEVPERAAPARRRPAGTGEVAAGRDRGVTGIGCSIFRREVEALRQAGRVRIPVEWETSMLHLRPKLLRERLATRLAEQQREGRRPFLLYGECHHGMTDQLAAHGSHRTAGLNCLEILLGRRRYRELREAGAFVLMPEWARRWREIFEVELGLSPAVMRDFMGEMHTKLVYLNTALVPVPTAELEAMSAAFGLPFEVIDAPLDHLAEVIETARQQAEGGAP